MLCIGLFGIALFSSTLLSFSTFQCKMLGYVTSSFFKYEKVKRLVVVNAPFTDHLRTYASWFYGYDKRSTINASFTDVPCVIYLVLGLPPVLVVPDLGQQNNHTICYRPTNAHHKPHTNAKMAIFATAGLKSEGEDEVDVKPTIL